MTTVEGTYKVKGKSLDMFLAYWLVCMVSLVFLAIGFQNIGIIVIGLIGVIVFSLCAVGLDRKDIHRFTIYTFVGLLFMLLVYCGLIEKYGEPFYGGDDKLFEKNGEYLFRNNIFRFNEVPYIQGMVYAKGYLTIVAWIYRVSYWFGGYSTITPRVLNIFLWMATVALVYKNSLIKTDKYYTKKKWLPILALFPNALFISSCVYRDTIVTFLMVLGIVSFEGLVNCVSKRKISRNIAFHLLCVLLSVYVLHYIRPQMVYVHIVIFILYMVWGKLKLSLEKKILLFAGAAAIAFIVFIYSGGMNLLRLIMDSYHDYRIDVNDGMTGKIFSMSLIPFGFVARFLYGLICPFPGGIMSLPYYSAPIYSMLMLLIYAATIYQFYLIPYLMRGIMKIDYRTFRFVIIYSAIIITTFTFRHFIMVYPFAFVAICRQIEGLSVGVKRKWINRMSILLIAGAAAYIILKLL